MVEFQNFVNLSYSIKNIKASSFFAFAIQFPIFNPTLIYLLISSQPHFVTLLLDRLTIKFTKQKPHLSFSFLGKIKQKCIIHNHYELAPLGLFNQLLLRLKCFGFVLFNLRRAFTPSHKLRSFFTAPATALTPLT